MEIGRTPGVFPPARQAAPPHLVHRAPRPDTLDEDGPLPLKKCLAISGTRKTFRDELRGAATILPDRAPKPPVQPPARASAALGSITFSPFGPSEVAVDSMIARSCATVRPGFTASNLPARLVT